MRDLFSAGSVANLGDDNHGGLYIERALRRLPKETAAAAARLPDAHFIA
jgi:hypothetical protein